MQRNISRISSRFLSSFTSRAVGGAAGSNVNPASVVGTVQDGAKKQGLARDFSDASLRKPLKDWLSTPSPVSINSQNPKSSGNGIITSDDGVSYREQDIPFPPLSAFFQKVGKKAEGKSSEIKRAVATIPAINEDGSVRALGRRKTAVAEVFLVQGKGGGVTVNGQDIVDYFPRDTSRHHVLLPLLVTNSLMNVSAQVNVSGGGKSAQAGAVMLGIARALQPFDPSFRSILKSGELLRRDPRMVERKKAGLRKARRAYQWVKR